MEYPRASRARQKKMLLVSHLLIWKTALCLTVSKYRALHTKRSLSFWKKALAARNCLSFSQDQSLWLRRSFFFTDHKQMRPEACQPVIYFVVFALHSVSLEKKMSIPNKKTKNNRHLENCKFHHISLYDGTTLMTLMTLVTLVT